MNGTDTAILQRPLAAKQQDWDAFAKGVSQPLACRRFLNEQKQSALKKREKVFA